MKSSCNKEEPHYKKKYVFFSDPDVILKKSEAFGTTEQTQEFPDFEQGQKNGINQVGDNELVDLPTQPVQGTSNDCLVQKHVKPYPFAFLTAVKRKFALGEYSETCKKVREPEEDKQEKINSHGSNTNVKARKTYSQSNQKIDFIQPLKVPDLKISPKTLDYSVRENSSLSEASINKFDMLSKDYAQREGKTVKNFDRVQRKLDFSSSFSSHLNDENEEGLKTPDFSISPNVVKKKEHLRDNSREKENRTKRIKKDDCFSKVDNSSQNITKRLKNMEHLSRKDVSESAVKKTRNERLLYNFPKETDFGLKKQKSKNLTSSGKKEEDKRHRSSTQHSKSLRDKSLELKGRSFSNESINLSERNANAQDKASVKDFYKDLTIETPQILKAKEVDKSVKNLHQNQQSSHRNLETEAFSAQSSAKNEESRHLSVTSDRTQGDISVESQNSTDIFPEMLLDPRRISFRDDSYSQQEEFSNLVTPDINLMLRSKRRKQFLQENSKGNDYTSFKNKPTITVENEEEEEIQLLHPTALHMQFQAELNLLDSFNESLRQVMDVESSIYNAKHAEERMLLQKEKLANVEMKKQLNALRSEKEVGLNKAEAVSVDTASHDESPVFLDGKPCEGSKLPKKNSALSQEDAVSQITSVRNLSEKTDDNANKRLKSLVKVAEVQTQTANDIATQTDVKFCQSRILSRLEEVSGVTYQRGPSAIWDIPRFSLESLGQDDNFGQVDDVSLASKMRGMSEISLHETTSSIKTETGTEISISTRDVTCSFNKDLALEMAQLIQDEKQRYDKIKMLFKSREKTLNDRTKKLVKLEEQKRQLRDTGQDSRISSVKKKQRALLLKLQQEKDEMNRLKELHKIASQERKLMLQKQRDMFNPEMSTKNILTKLKRSADSQSPRRLSGPMKGYDIRSNSSMSSLVDSDKSQIDRSQVDMRLQAFDSSLKQDDEQYSRLDFDAVTSEKSDNNKCEMLSDGNGSASASFSKLNMMKALKKSKYDIKSRKFEEKMPRADILRQIELHSQLKQGSVIALPGQSQSRENAGLPPMYPIESAFDHEKSESDTVIKELSGKSKYLQFDPHIIVKSKPQKKLNSETDNAEDGRLKKVPRSSTIDEPLEIKYKGSKKVEKPLLIEKEDLKKFPSVSDAKSSSKRKGFKSHKTKSTPDILVENFLRTKSDSQVWEEVIGHHNKRSKLEAEQSDDNYQNSILEELDFNESQSSLRALLKHSKAVKDKNYQLLRDMASDREAKENIKAFEELDKKGGQLENFSQTEDKESLNMGNISTRSQVSTLTISHHSSGDSEKSYSRSVVIRSQNNRLKTSKKLEQILNARETALASRRTCVEEWIAWHTRLREEESRVARMEQAAYKLVNAASQALSYHDTTVSSDVSDVEGRIELLAQKLADRRVEMAKLKKEARKQAKQRLRAMEASLLNQIKKYDSTIHEMRKTLETGKESTKNIEKPVIESKSVTDFKIPEIPIKRIHEIYKSSDLLQSKSSSNFIKNNIQENLSPSCKLSESKCNENSELKSQDKIELNDPIENESNSILRPDSLLENAQFQETVNLQSKTSSLTSESLLSEINTMKSKTEIPLSGRKVEEISKSSTEISEIIENPATSLESGEVQCLDTESLSFSRKLDHIGVNSKNLNDDISTLESDLKRLSEMMLQINKKSASKNKEVSVEEHSEKRTSEDISEYLPESIESKGFQNSKSEIIEDLKSIDIDISDDDLADQNLGTKIDFKARSKEMLNEIEKSIISDHIKTLEIDQTDQTFEEGMQNLQKESQVLSNDLTSLEGDIKSISEMISKASQNQSFEPLDSSKHIRENSKNFGSITEDLEIDSEKNEIPQMIVSITKKSSNLSVENPEAEDLEDETEDLEIEIEDLQVETVDLKIEIEEKVDDDSEKNEIPPKIVSITNKFSNLSVENSEETEDLEDETDPFDLEIETEDLQVETEDQEIEIEEKVDDDSEKNEIPQMIVSITKKSSNLSVENSEEAEDQEDETEDLEIETEDLQVETVDQKIEIEEKVDDDSKKNEIPQMIVSITKKSSNLSVENSEEAEDQEDETEDLEIETEDLQVKTVDQKIEIEEKVDDDSEKNEIPQMIVSITKKSSNLSVENPEEAENLEDETEDLEIETEDLQIETEDQEIEFEKKVDDDWTISKSFEFQNLEEIKNQQAEVLDKKEDESDFKGESLNLENNRTAEIDESGNDFIPLGESTNIEILTNFEKESELETESLKETSLDDQSSFHSELLINLSFIEKKDTFQKLFMPKCVTVLELEPESLEGHGLPELELELKVIFPDDLETSQDNPTKEKLLKEVEISECFEIEDQDSSEGEQLDNLVEVAEDKLETLEKVKESDPEKLENSLNNTESHKTFSVLRNPQYEDISEESLEISLIFDKIESDRSQKLTVPEKYEAGKAEDVAKIMDAISAKYGSKSDQVVCFESGLEEDQMLENEFERKAVYEQEENSVKISETDDSDSSEGDTGKNISKLKGEVEEDFNESRLDIESLDDDLLSSISIHQNLESNVDFHVTPIVSKAEKDITAMIDKLKASLKQPGLEVPELDATLLRIEQLQIELEIKKLEAEEVSYYVREIPNKPPPPYTPPGSGMVPTSLRGRVTASLGSPSPPPAVIPTNVDDLTAFTEKATSLIYKARESGEDVMSLEAPPEIWDLSKDSETLRKDRRIYNTFLFDLCKETITEIYRLENKQPGPSWTRQSVKITSAISIPKNLQELTEYVNKEIATLFGFKTKLQRENMVMRWSRKRRDRVDELLAREAQAEEDEWTKFHCDELAVKNGLTVSILDSLVLETVNVVKTAFTKRSKLRVQQLF